MYLAGQHFPGDVLTKSHRDLLLPRQTKSLKCKNSAPVAFDLHWFNWLEYQLQGYPIRHEANNRSTDGESPVSRKEHQLDHLKQSEQKSKVCPE
jgi:hypothetical protein